MGGISLWHGARRWNGKPEVRPGAKGRMECGPGIYLTTSYETARSYGSSLMRFTLPANIRWLEDAQVELSDMKAFVNGQHRMLRKAKVLDDLNWSADKHGTTLLPANYLVNLCINNDALAGAAGPALAAWLAERGIDASLYGRRSTEDWVVIFNPACIMTVQNVSPADVDLSEWHLPLVKDQIAADYQTSNEEDEEAPAPAA